MEYLKHSDSVSHANSEVHRKTDALTGKIIFILRLFNNHCPLVQWYMTLTWAHRCYFTGCLLTCLASISHKSPVYTIRVLMYTYLKVNKSLLQIICQVFVFLSFKHTQRLPAGHIESFLSLFTRFTGTHTYTYLPLPSVGRGHLFSPLPLLCPSSGPWPHSSQPVCTPRLSSSHSHSLVLSQHICCSAPPVLLFYFCLSLSSLTLSLFVLFPVMRLLTGGRIADNRQPC